MVQVYRRTVAKIHNCAHLLRTSKGQRHFRILYIINALWLLARNQKNVPLQKIRTSLFHVMSEIHREGSSSAWDAIAKFGRTEASVQRTLSIIIGFASTWPAPCSTLSELHARSHIKGYVVSWIVSPKIHIYQESKNATLFENRLHIH